MTGQGGLHHDVMGKTTDPKDESMFVNDPVRTMDGQPLEEVVLSWKYFNTVSQKGAIWIKSSIILHLYLAIFIVI